MSHNKENPLTRHHIIPRSRGGVNDPENIAMLRQTKHRALHCLFENTLPTEQMRKLVTLAESVLQPRYRKELLMLLDEPREYVYERGIMVPKRQ